MDHEQPNILAMKKPLMELAGGRGMECSDDGLHRRILPNPRPENLSVEMRGMRVLPEADLGADGDVLFLDEIDKGLRCIAVGQTTLVEYALRGGTV